MDTLESKSARKKEMKWEKRGMKKMAREVEREAELEKAKMEHIEKLKYLKDSFTAVQKYNANMLVYPTGYEPGRTEMLIAQAQVYPAIRMELFERVIQVNQHRTAFLECDAMLKNRFGKEESIKCYAELGIERISFLRSINDALVESASKIVQQFDICYWVRKELETNDEDTRRRGSEQEEADEYLPWVGVSNVNHHVLGYNFPLICRNIISHLKEAMKATDRIAKYRPEIEDDDPYVITKFFRDHMRIAELRKTEVNALLSRHVCERIKILKFVDLRTMTVAINDLSEEYGYDCSESVLRSYTAQIQRNFTEVIETKLLYYNEADILVSRKRRIQKKASEELLSTLREIKRKIYYEERLTFEERCIVVVNAEDFMSLYDKEEKFHFRPIQFARNRD